MLETLSGDLFQKLKIFHYIMQYGSLSKAAAVMHRSSSSVSRQLQQLEDELGTTLLLRRSDGMIPTPEGEALYVHTLELFQRLESMITSITSPNRKTLSGTVRIIASPVAAETILARVLPGLRQHYPDITLEIRSATGVDNVVRALTTHSYHFALAAEIPDVPAVSFQPLFQSPVWLVAPQGYPVPEGIASDCRLWPTVPLVGMAENVAIMRFVNGFCVRNGITLNYQHLAPSLHFQIRMVEAGLGLAFADSIYLQTLNFSGLQTFPLADLPPRTFGLLQRNNAFQPPHVRAVIQLILSHFQQGTAANEPCA